MASKRQPEPAAEEPLMDVSRAVEDRPKHATKHCRSCNDGRFSTGLWLREFPPEQSQESGEMRQHGRAGAAPKILAGFRQVGMIDRGEMPGGFRVKGGKRKYVRGRCQCRLVVLVP